MKKLTKFLVAIAILFMSFNVSATGDVDEDKTLTYTRYEVVVQFIEELKEAFDFESLGINLVFEIDGRPYEAPMKMELWMLEPMVEPVIWYEAPVQLEDWMLKPF